MENELNTVNTIEEAQSKSNYSDLYKYNAILDNQHNRRNKLLLELKERRNDQVNELRGIGDVFEENDIEENEPVDALKHQRKKFQNYGHKIMLSEWMTEVPTDLEDEWLFKVCPLAIRNIIVASHGVTKAYNRRNQKKATFQSNLPGGNRETSQTFTLLDCIYRNQERTYYVLDVLVWNSCSLMKCTTEFRFFFLKSKLLEHPDLVTSSDSFKFVNLEYESASLPSIENFFLNKREIPLDGILFYHKSCIYTSGPTPLVGWLKPYMIPEKLNIPVHMSYMERKPKDYVSLDEYLDNVKKKYKKGKYGVKESNEMETDLKEEDGDTDEMN